MAGEEYCISAGAFARMCQTTRDTLRYYEKQGILVPKKSEKNGYHYYSYAQISSYYFISTFRGLGCSVEDIKEYLLGGEEVRFDGFVDRQYAGPSLSPPSLLFLPVSTSRPSSSAPRGGGRFQSRRDS